MREGLFEGDGFDTFAFGEWRKTGFFATIFFVFAELNKAAVFANFGINCFAGFWVVTEETGVVVALDSFGGKNIAIEAFIKITEHDDAVKFVVGNKIEVFFDCCGEFVVDNVFEIVGQEARDKFANRSRNKFAFVGAVFLLDDLFLDSVVA